MNENRLSTVIVKDDSIEKELPQYLSAAQISLLETKTPVEHIKQRKGYSGKMLNYVSAAYVVKQLNRLFGYLWDFEVLKEIVNEDEVIVMGKLTLKSTSSLHVTKT